MLRCCVAIMAYNEEANVGNMLDAICQQRLEKVDIAEIVVVASGCTDRTEEIVRQFVRQDPRVRLISQRRRNGKSAAVNLLLQKAQEEIIVLANADTVPTSGAIERLVAPFEDPQIGMTGGHPIPTNDLSTFMGYVVHLLWRLHHDVSLHYPKMGELVAFRNIFSHIPPESAVDEASIEPLIHNQGLRLRYVPQAIVYNRGPETLKDFIKQRRRIYTGHLYVKETTGYQVATLNGFRILPFFLRAAEPDWRYVLWGPWGVVWEIIARLLGVWDYRVRKREHRIWDVVETTKRSIQVPSSVSADINSQAEERAGDFKFSSCLRLVVASVNEFVLKLINTIKQRLQRVPATTMPDSDEQLNKVYVSCADCLNRTDSGCAHLAEW